MAKSKKIRVRLKAYDHKILDLSVEKIVAAANNSGAKVVGPIPLPTEKQVYTILRAVHAHLCTCEPPEESCRPKNRSTRFFGRFTSTKMRVNSSKSERTNGCWTS